ncbi:MAG: hypothetical protein H8D23_28755 [Candidatus Brocadiales bacterium]|nr:hypothetical protein [Candidatus Brocadiales bacterium]
MKKILKEHPEKDIVIVAESLAFLLLADALASGNDNNQVYKYGFNKERIRFFYRTGRSILGGYVKLLFLFIRYILTYTYCVHKDSNGLKKVSVIVDTYIFDNSFDKEGKFTNSYFSELHQFLWKSGIPVVIYPILFNIPFKRLKHIFKSIYQSKTKFLLLEDFLKPLDYLRVFFNTLQRLRCFEKVQDFMGIKIQPLVNEENWVNLCSSNSILSLLVNKLPKRLHERGVNPDVYINWSENQTIHKAIISGMHKYFSKTKIIGGKPFFPPLNHLNLFNTEKERDFGYAPDKIVTCGKKLKNIFSTYDKDSHYDVGPSFRYGYLRKLTYNNHTHPGDISKHKVISVILPQNILFSRHILSSSTRAIQNAIIKGWDIKVKMHPTHIKSEEAMLLKEYDMKSGCIELTHEKMESLLPKSSAILTSESGVTVEAICLGIPVVAIGMPIGLDLNILDYLPSSMWKLAFTDDGIDLGLNKWALKHPLSSEERGEIGCKVLKDFFEKSTNDSLQVYIESLQSI